MVLRNLRRYTDYVLMELLAIMSRVMLVVFLMSNQYVRKVLYHLYAIELSSEVLKGIVEVHAIRLFKCVAVEVPFIALTSH